MPNPIEGGHSRDPIDLDLNIKISSIMRGIVPGDRPAIEHDMFKAVHKLGTNLARAGKTQEEIRDSLRWAIDIYPELLQRRIEWEELNEDNSR